MKRWTCSKRNDDDKTHPAVVEPSDGGPNIIFHFRSGANRTCLCQRYFAPLNPGLQNLFIFLSLSSFFLSAIVAKKKHQDHDGGMGMVGGNKKIDV
jgi:hypothetical protein